MIDLHNILGWPVSPAGKWSMYLAFGFLGLMLLFYGLLELGQKGGATFLANPLLAGTLLLAAASGIASGLAAAFAITVKKERAAALYVAVFMGFFVLAFVAGELMGGH